MKKPLEEVLKECTRGPWEADGNDEVLGNTDCVADCCADYCPPQDQRKANAALIAHFRNVGPELVEELEWCAESFLVLNEPGFAARVRAILSRAKEVEVP